MGEGGGGDPPEEPPADEPVPFYGLINQVMDKTKGGDIASKNRFSILDYLEEGDEEAGAPTFDRRRSGGKSGGDRGEDVITMFSMGQI